MTPGCERDHHIVFLRHGLADGEIGCGDGEIGCGDGEIGSGDGEIGCGDQRVSSSFFLIIGVCE